MKVEDPIAKEINECIKRETPALFEMLSPYGQKLYLPYGILQQSAEAKIKAHKFNATIGIATENKVPMHLRCVQQYLSDALNPNNVYPYAPTSGVMALRKIWAERLNHSNPSLKHKLLSLPIVTSGITNGLSLAVDLFIANDDPVIMPDKFWGNYKLQFGLKVGGQIKTFPLFDEGLSGFNIRGLQKILDDYRSRKIVVVLNFPNNPTGYTPTVHEAREIKESLAYAAEKGTQIVAICDDAYFGMVYEPECAPESIFADLCDLHENIIAVKVDGATKEAFVWGFRVGFLTFGSKGATAAVYDCLEKKVAGAIRASLSGGPHPSQSILVEAMGTPDFANQCAEKLGILKRRYLATRNAAGHEKYKRLWRVYPFNSGYFMCLQLRDVRAEPLRQHLLEKHGVGTISSGEHDLRVAFCSVEESDIDALFAIIAQGVGELK